MERVEKLMPPCEQVTAGEGMAGGIGEVAGIKGGASLIGSREEEPA